MRFLRKNGGFTLVELLVTIVVGSLATMAAATVLILGLRIYNNANDTALKQNEVNIGITVIENLVAEEKITAVTTYEVTAETGTVLVYDDNEDIVKTGAGATILTNVRDFSISRNNKGNMLSFVIVMDEAGEECYEFSVYCRMSALEEVTEPDPSASGEPQAVSEGNAAVFSLPRSQDAETVLTSALEDDTLTLNVRAFLNVLSSQQGSTGRIQTPDGEGEYYSEWYIGGYENNPDWNGGTPWCACFVSWALEECGGYIQGETPRYANVDTFCTDLVTSGDWKDSNPVPGDLIFFDWSADGDYNPEHIGVVTGTDGSRVYTIEGNVNGRVALCSYASEDERILGYGLVNWTR